MALKIQKIIFLLHFNSIARVLVLRNEMKDTCLGQFLGSSLYLFHPISSAIVCINKLHDYDERLCSLSNDCRGNRKKTLQCLLRGEILHERIKSKRHILSIKN